MQKTNYSTKREKTVNKQETHLKARTYSAIRKRSLIQKVRFHNLDFDRKQNWTWESGIIRQMSATRYRKGVATVVDADHRSFTEARAYDEDYINNNNITLNDVQSIEDLGSYVANWRTRQQGRAKLNENA
ncbi:unnamed protein product [Rhizophagus irregularis]|nr:unnamed protein product [Rhizophagus irregularis]CAB4431903.1 unnamed protein product [Rhizophagus irregularis]